MSSDDTANATTTTNDAPSTTTQSSQQQQQYYFCYQCNRTISLPPPSPSSSELSCPHCNGGFLEEVDTPNHNLNLDPPFNLLSSPLFSTPSSNSAADQLAPFAPFPFPPSSDLPSPDAFNPLHFLDNYLQSMRAGGANIQFVIENSDHNNTNTNTNLRLPLPVPVPANFGDYFFGPGLEQLIQQLAENDPNRYGTPPAAKTAVERLPNVKVTEELLSSDSSQCAVCMDEFQLGGEAKQMPCKHFFHSDCILPWLELHNSCPVCRHELPTDDPDYEQRARGRRENNAGGNGNGDGGSGEGSRNDRPVETRFSISLPWPFGPPGNVAEGSNSSNQGRRDNADFGSETRYEDLD